MNDAIDPYPIQRLVCFWLDTVCGPGSTSRSPSCPSELAECVRAIMRQIGGSDDDALLAECAPADPDVMAVLSLVGDTHRLDGDALSRWVVRTVADFLVRVVTERSAGGWGDADLAGPFKALANPDTCPDALLVAAVDETNAARRDVIGRMMSSLTCNYRLSHSALAFLVRCVEEAYVDEEELSPALLDAFEHQCHCDADLRMRMLYASSALKRL